MSYDQDLFGDPPDIPKRGTKAREEYASKLELPYGLTYWSLAPDCLAPGVPDFVECLWTLDHRRRFVRLIVDLRTGQKWGREAQQTYLSFTAAEEE